VSPRLSSRSRSVAGRVALITGAASGMGRATAHLFADEGAFVAVTDVTLDGAAVVAEEILESGGKAAAWSLDVRDDERVRGLVDFLRGRFGPPPAHLLIKR
jgi:3-oxoacyl-[acyl-carrier protein] reductase